MQSGDYPCLMAPAGPWELTFFLGVGTYFSRVSAIFFLLVFFGVFVVLGGCFCAFLVFFFVFRAQREFFFGFFFPR